MGPSSSFTTTALLLLGLLIGGAQAGVEDLLSGFFSSDTPKNGDDLMQQHLSITEDAITFGSVIKLQHIESNYYLHSHQINWGTGSGQQSVTAHGGQDDQGSLWIVQEGQNGEFKEVGEPVLCGSIIRLSHLQTAKNLHSHLFQSPLSNQQEVSAFGEDGRGDTGDNWEVICKSTGWRRGQEVKFRHKDTGKYLHSSTSNKFTQKNCPNCPIIGQQEVTTIASAAPQTSWKAQQGIFFHPKTEEGKDEL